MVAINPKRGTGSLPKERLTLLRRAIHQTTDDGACVYLTSAGFFGCAAPAGDSSRDFRWPGDLDLSGLNRQLGNLALGLPSEKVLGIGVEQSPEYADQRIWWYRGESRTRYGETVRANTSMSERLIEVGGFRLLAFVCGELYDGGSGFDPAADTDDIDVVLDAAHGSVARAWNRVAMPPRCAFQRAFATIGQYCGGALSQAHDEGDEYARRQDNWLVYRGELPFPDVEVAEI